MGLPLVLVSQNYFIVFMIPLLCLYIAVDCGSLSDPGNGIVDASNTTFMNTATYTCNTGYNLASDTTRTCQANGTWSGTVPTCDRKSITSK